MINHLSSFEYVYALWLATDGRMPMNLLLDPKFEDLFNLPKPSWDKVTVVDLLIELETKKLIQFHHGSCVLRLGMSEILNQLSTVNFDDRVNSYSYSLTAKGGELWEKVFKPNWEKAVLYSFSSEQFTDECLVRLESSSLQKICSTFDVALSDLKNPHGESAKITRVSPWFPLYWKQLPEGYIVDSIRESTLPDEFHRRIIAWHTSIETVLQLD